MVDSKENYKSDARVNNYVTVGLSSYLRGHNKLMINNIVGCVSHTKQSTSGVKMTRHSCSHVDVFSNALRQKCK